MYQHNYSTKVQSYSGQWNVQVVRGKVTTRCLWNACKALSLGLILLLIGTVMAVIGYYADQLSEGAEIRGNHTVSIRYESRGFHLNNLSYAGPIVMGAGGFIVVAACVMTFEARDSAAKVVPARLKANPSISAISSSKSTPKGVRPSTRAPPRKSTSCQTKNVHAQQLPHTFLQFSKTLVERSSRTCMQDFTKLHGEKLVKSPSAPNLTEQEGTRKPMRLELGICSLLSPQHLLPRQAVSMDCSTNVSQASFDGFNGPNMGSMAVDLHECNVTLQVKDESVEKKPRLLRQRPVIEENFECRKKKNVTRHQSLRLEPPSIVPCTLGRHRLTSQSTHQTIRKIPEVNSAGCSTTRRPIICCRHPSSPCKDNVSAPIGRQNSRSSCSGVPCVRQPRQDSRSSCTTVACCSYTPSRQSSCTSTSAGSFGGVTPRRCSRVSCPSPCQSRSQNPRRASRARSLSPSFSLTSSPSRKSSLPATSGPDPPSDSLNRTPSSTLPI